MINALIIDDEPMAHDTLKSVLDLYCPQIKIVGSAFNISDAKKLIETFSPQLLFLDIDMPNGSGFELLEQFTSPSFEIIFITAHNQHAIKAFKFSAIDYILKPIHPADLQEGVNKASAKLESKNLHNQFITLLQNLKPNQQTKKLVLKTTDSVFVVETNEIYYCEADRNYTIFYLTNARKIMVSTTLKEYDELLRPYNFFRPHQSYLINVTQIEKVDKRDGGNIILKNGTTIPVATRKKDELMNLLKRL